MMGTRRRNWILTGVSSCFLVVICAAILWLPVMVHASHRDVQANHQHQEEKIDSKGLSIIGSPNDYTIEVTFITKAPAGPPTAQPSQQIPGATTTTSLPSSSGSDIQTMIPSSHPSMQYDSAIPSYQVEATDYLTSAFPSSSTTEEIATTLIPTFVPTLQPSASPAPSELPSSLPSDESLGSISQSPFDPLEIASSPLPSTTTKVPTDIPTTFPSVQPSSNPSFTPTDRPSDVPSTIPTMKSSSRPSTSLFPSHSPSQSPTASIQPSGAPSATPSSLPSNLPSKVPSNLPSSMPSDSPSAHPSLSPTTSFRPSDSPSQSPTTSILPSAAPSFIPTSIPSSLPSESPSNMPSSTPSDFPSASPSNLPTTSALPSESPSDEPSTSPSQAPTDYFGESILYVIADTPYTEEERLEMPRLLSSIGDDALFAVHLGDIIGTTEPCNNETFSRFESFLKQSPVPFFVVPGDNEYTDCGTSSRERQAALELWRQHFVRFDAKYWNHTLDVTTMPGRPESFTFEHRGTLFFGLNIVGLPRKDRAEWKERLSSQVEWMIDLIDDRRDGDNAIGSIVIMGHAQLREKQHADFLDPLLDYIEDDLDNEIPVLYLQGDVHSWAYDRKYHDQSSFVRVRKNSGTVDPALKIITHPTRSGVESRREIKGADMFDVIRFPDQHEFE